MRTSIVLSFLVGCAGGGPAGEGSDPTDPTDPETSVPPATGPGPTDPSPTDPTTPPGGGPLAPGFEDDLTDLGSCLGSFVATDAGGTIGLVLDVNDLSGAAYLAGADTVTDVDLTVDGWRLEVVTGSGLDVATLCGHTDGAGTIDVVYAPVSGDATVWIWPHQTQPESNEGAAELADVLLRAPGEVDVVLDAWSIPRQGLGGR